MKKVLIIAISSAAVILSGCSKSESYSKPGYDFGRIDKVAVVSVTGAVRHESVKTQISDFFTMELLKKGYSPIERRQIQELITEQDFQASKLTTDEGAAQAGKILNVPAVFIINIPEFGEDINMTAKMVDVQDGSILWMGSGEGTTGKTMATILGAVGGAVIGSQLSSDHRTATAIGGGIAGGIAGNVLTPNETKMVKKIMTNMCITLPTRF